MPGELKSVKCTKVDHSTKNVIYILVATFADDTNQIENRYVGKTVSDLMDFRKNVLQMSKDQKNSSSAAQPLPDLKEKKGFIGGWRDDKNRTSVDEFCQRVLKLPSSVLKENAVTNFFLDSSAGDEDSAIQLFKSKDSFKKQSKGKSAAAVSPSALTTSQPTPSVSSDSPTAPYSINTYEEIGNLSNFAKPFSPPLSGIYSEVKLDSVNQPFVATDNDNYADCVLTSPLNKGGDAETEAVPKQTGRHVNDDQQLYASVYKPPTAQPPDTKESADDGLYEDTVGFPETKSDAVLYEDATTTNSRRQVPPKPSSVNSSVSEVTSAQPKPPTPASAPVAPLTPVPPMPHFPSPVLQSSDITLDELPGGDDATGEIQVVAISDYDSTTDNVLSFKKGTLATLLLKSDSNWWCIQLGSTRGWVPTAYWRILISGECMSVVTKGNSPWFIGKLSRAECEALLMEHGKQQHFVVRESNSGHYALSVKHNDKIHHFPIEVTADKKFNIGKHDFKTVNNIIVYYQKNALFHDDGHEVTLGSPLVIIKH